MKARKSNEPVCPVCRSTVNQDGGCRCGTADRRRTVSDRKTDPARGIKK